MKVAKELTPTSWLVYNEQNLKEGILSKNNRKYTFIGSNGVTEMPSKDEMEKFFVKIRFESRTFDEVDDTNIINEYPVDTDTFYNVDIDEFPHTFTKRESSSVKYVAGYFGLKFAHGYVLAWCPKQSTYEKYDAIGPFKNSMVAKHEISLENSKMREDDGE